MNKPVKVLIVEDSEDDAKLALRALRGGGFDPTSSRVQTAADLETALAGERWDAVISDYNMPGFTGMDALGIFRSTRLDIPFILISGTIGEDTAVDAMKAGASDYLMKKSLARLAPALERELKETQMRAAHGRAQQALIDSEKRFRQMAESIQDAFFLIDADNYRLLYISPAYEEIWGRSRESLYANPNLRIEAIHPDDRASTDDKFRKGIAAGKFEYETRIVRPDGSIRWIDVTGFPVRDAAGKMVRITCVAKDITERKQAAQELRESERRFSDLMGNIEMVSVMLDTNARITYCNNYFLRLSGWQREEVIGRIWYELFVAPEIDYMNNAFAALLANRPEALHRESEIITRSGERRLIRWNNSLLKSGVGEVIGTASIGEDITESKKAEHRIAYLNRIYAVLSGINALIVRVRDRDELLREACRIAVDQGRFRMAWIGMVDRKAMKIEPVASAGSKPEYIAFIKDHFSLAQELPSGNTMTARAIREKKAYFSNDAQNDPRIWFKKEHIESGTRSIAVLPLLVSNEAVGALVLYAEEVGFFDAAELSLLTELAGNISFALEHIEKEQEVDRLTRMHAILTGINGAIVRIRDRQVLFRECCRIAAEAGRLRLAWIGMVDPIKEEIRPAAFSGADQGMLGIIRLSTREDSGRFGLAGRAIRDRAPVVSNDVLADAQAHYRMESAQRGFRSVAMIPLMVEGAAVGVLGLHAAEPGFFNQDALKLVTEIAGNIAFALEYVDNEEKVRRLTRVQAVLSGINALIVRVGDRNELFTEACRIAVEAGGFRMSMIAIVDRSTMKIVPAASAGVDEELLTDVKSQLSSSGGAPEAETIFARVIREKTVALSSVSPDQPTVMFGRKSTGSTAVLPLLVSDEAVGVLALYASETEFFHEEEMKLLTELAGDIAFAVDHLDKRERLDYLAYYDVLTGLANRTLFLDRVAQYMRSAASGGHKLAVFLLDLERFKNINDSLGRPAGDELLRRVAEWLTRYAGDASLVARIGADHFAVVLPEVRPEGDVVRLLEKTLESTLDHSIRLNEAVFRITAKVGAAIFPDDGANAETLFRNAEAALKKAKASGERYLFYTQVMTASTAGKLSLENKLRLALDDREFVLHYQPKVNLASGKVTGAEALIRWNDPRTGLVPPGRFIPILEETGLIHEVGRWALGQAIADYLRWRAAGLPAVRIAVNVSPLQLRHRGFIAEIEQAIGIDAQAAAGLELEITESLIMQNVKLSIASLGAIRDLGIRVAIDDFGTGFSSLSYLAKLPVDTLKIDHSFVIEMTTSPQGLALVSTIINLAHALNLKVVAEGVETEEQSRLLRLLACDEMQGFLFCKPVPVDIFEKRFLAPAAG